MADPLTVQARARFTKNKNHIIKFEKYRTLYHPDMESNLLIEPHFTVLYLLSSRHRSASTRFSSRDYITSQLSLSRVYFYDQFLDGALENIGYQNNDGLWCIKDAILGLVKYSSVDEALIDPDIEENYNTLKKIKRRIRSIQGTIADPAYRMQSTDIDLLNTAQEEHDTTFSLNQSDAVQDLINQEEEQIRLAEQVSFDELTPFNPHVPNSNLMEGPNSDTGFLLRGNIKRKFEELETVLIETEKTFSFFKDANEQAKKQKINVDHLCPSTSTKEVWQKDFQRILQDVTSSLESHFNYQYPKILSPCSICQDYLQNPQVLDCGHLLCLECISSPNFKKFRYGGLDKIICPLCKKKGFFHQIYL